MSDDKPGGFLYLYRCLETEWQWERPLWRGAWVWLLMKAAYKDMPDKSLKRGQVWFSVTWGPKVWNMSEKQTRIFLKRAENEKDILWERGRGGKKRMVIPGNTLTGEGGQKGGQKGTQSGGESDGQWGRITLLKYDKFQPSQNNGGGESDGQKGGQCVGDQGGVLKEVKRSTKKEEKELRSFGTKKPTRESVELEMNALDLEKFKKDHPNVNVYEEFEAFKDHFLWKNDTKTSKPNWTKWTHWGRAFGGWLRNAKKFKPSPGLRSSDGKSMHEFIYGSEE